MIKVVAFDLDDTLYPEREYVLSGFRAVSEVVEQRFGVGNSYPELVKTFNGGEKKNTFDATLEKLGIEHDEELIQDLVDSYRAHVPNIKVYDDVVPTLECLKRRYHLAMITDGYLQAQRNKVNALAIQEFFERIIYTDQYGKQYWKPSSFPFQLVMRHFSVIGGQCAYVGDNVEKDFIAPNKLGWLTVQIKRKERQYVNNVSSGDRSPQVSIHNMGDLEKVLEEKHG